MRLLFLTIWLMAMLTISAQTDSPSAKPLQTVADVDLARYAGTWYEIARLPNRFQKKCAGEVVATYTLLGDGEIEVVNRCRTANGQLSSATGRARLASQAGPASKLQVRFAPAFLSFLPMVWGDYWIIDLAPDYSYAVVGEPERKYLWILSRTAVLPEATYQAIVSRLGPLGFDVARLVRTRQVQ